MGTKSRAQPPSPGDCDQVLGPDYCRKGGTRGRFTGSSTTETRTPNWHRANIAHKECGWKDGDRGGPAQTQNPLVRKRKTDLTLTGLLMEGPGVFRLDESCLVAIPHEYIREDRRDENYRKTVARPTMSPLYQMSNPPPTNEHHCLSQLALRGRCSA